MCPLFSSFTRLAAAVLDHFPERVPKRKTENIEKTRFSFSAASAFLLSHSLYVFFIFFIIIFLHIAPSEFRIFFSLYMLMHNYDSMTLWSCGLKNSPYMYSSNHTLGPGD